ncbi:expressed unknown protein [Seminavis robusta]|uniref:F-box protein n=1 Tax=Seminavis robusta TaxID=568900 RepID=A0A9N8D7S6_9STRA|nr:expressed unknown protein [Seminavis robusta]|eukprot:Sro28_g018590.1 n/a (339) ;mRNA; r:34071-35087
MVSLDVTKTCGKDGSGSGSGSGKSVLCLLEEGGAEELLDNIFQFAGGRAVASMGRTSKFWRWAVTRESLWESMCRQHGKRRSSTCSGSQECYGNTLAVPQDIPSLSGAVRYCNGEFAKGKKHMTILLEQETTYQVREPLLVQAVGHNACLTIDCVFPSLSQPDPLEMRCANHMDVDVDADVFMEDQEWGDTDTLSEFSLFSYQTSIMLSTIKPNQPLFHVSEGTLDLKNAKLLHCSPIGSLAELKRSCNAAIMLEPTDTDACPPQARAPVPHMLVQPPLQTGLLMNQPDTNITTTPPSKSLPSLVLDNVTLLSYSGRGILNRHQANVVMENSQIIRVC